MAGAIRRDCTCGESDNLTGLFPSNHAASLVNPKCHTCVKVQGGRGGLWTHPCWVPRAFPAGSAEWCLCLRHLLIRIRSPRFQLTSNLEWKKLGRNSGGSHLYVSMPLGAEQRGEEGERKEGVEFRGWRGGYRGVCLLEGPE